MSSRLLSNHDLRKALTAANDLQLFLASNSQFWKNKLSAVSEDTSIQCAVCGINVYLSMSSLVNFDIASGSDTNSGSTV